MRDKRDLAVIYSVTYSWYIYFPEVTRWSWTVFFVFPSPDASKSCGRGMILACCFVCWVISLNIHKIPPWPMLLEQWPFGFHFPLGLKLYEWVQRIRDTSFLDIQGPTWSIQGSVTFSGSSSMLQAWLPTDSVYLRRNIWSNVLDDCAFTHLAKFGFGFRVNTAA